MTDVSDVKKKWITFKTLKGLFELVYLLQSNDGLYFQLRPPLSQRGKSYFQEAIQLLY